MTRRLALLPFVATWACALAATALAQPPRRPPPPAPVRGGSSLPSLPSIARVRLEAAPDHLLVVEEVNVPRGTWQAGDLDLYVAFGAPGAPIAFDVHLVPVADGALEALDGDVGEPVPIERAPRRPPSVQPLLGPSQMAGAILHLREAALRRAFAPGGMATVRIRTLLPLPEEDARTGREVLVRLGATAHTPLTLGRLQIASAPFVARAEAHLCGAEADPYPLAIALVPRGAPPPPSDHAPIAPVLAVRHESDDLCVRFWTQR